MKTVIKKKKALKSIRSIRKKKMYKDCAAWVTNEDQYKNYTAAKVLNAPEDILISESNTLVFIESRSNPTQGVISLSSSFLFHLNFSFEQSPNKSSQPFKNSQKLWRK